MKKFIRSIFVFIAFFMVVYTLLIAIGGRYPNLNYRLGSNGHMNSRIKEVNQSGKIDILFLGSSHAYRVFDTRIYEKMGLRAFNLGSSNQTHLQTKILLKRYLDRLNPKIVVYEINPEIMMLDGVESSLDLIANDKIDWDLTKMVFHINHLKTYNTFFHGIFRKGLHRDEYYVEDPIKKKDHYISGGFVESEMETYQFKDHPPKVIQPRKDQQEAFIENCKMIRNSGAKLYLVYSPTTQSLYKSYQGLKEYEDFLKGQGEYINGNELFQWNDSSQFSDSEHPNQIGVQLFNQLLLDSLKYE